MCMCKCWLVEKSDAANDDKRGRLGGGGERQDREGREREVGTNGYRCAVVDEKES